MKNKYLIIINKPSKSQTAFKIWPKIRAKLNNLNIRYQANVGTYKGNINIITEEYVKEAFINSILLVIGNDGLLNEVLNKVIITNQIYKRPFKIPIAYIPIGSGNIFARNHHIPLKWDKALNQILNCKAAKLIHIGHFQDKMKSWQEYFLSNIKIGNFFNPKRHYPKKWDYIKNFFNDLKILYELPSFPFTLYEGNHGKRFQRILSVNTEINKSHQFNMQFIEQKNFLTMCWLFLKLKFQKNPKSKLIHKINTPTLHFSIPTLEPSSADTKNLGSQFYDLRFSINKYPFIL